MFKDALRACMDLNMYRSVKLDLDLNFKLCKLVLI